MALSFKLVTSRHSFLHWQQKRKLQQSTAALRRIQLGRLIPKKERWRFLHIDHAQWRTVFEHALAEFSSHPISISFMASTLTSSTQLVNVSPVKES